MTLTLYAAPGSCAVAPAIALCEAGADFEIHAVDYAVNEQRSPAFLAVNPKGRTPALVTDHGVLTENPAILAYIAQLYPQANLAPLDDPFAFARLQSFNAWICSTLHPAFAHIFRPTRYADGEGHQAEVRRKGIEQVNDAFRMAEDEFFDGPWAVGERYTLADPYLYVMTSWLPRADLRQVDAYPKIAEHYARMRARPAVAEARARLGMPPP
ncbi:MAG TPA: glutathione S-transferase family protein [Caulobacteraceae bacterium]|nr:glutathione S-transferase family protein [Caulobacteraceae bacterium]